MTWQDNCLLRHWALMTRAAPWSDPRCPPPGVTPSRLTALDLQSWTPDIHLVVARPGRDVDARVLVPLVPGGFLLSSSSCQWQSHDCG